MSTYQFTHAQRWASFQTHGTTHGTNCWLCGEPLFFVDMEIDHVLPERLQLPENAGERARALEAFGLPSDFDLNSHENWLPAHGRCNTKKRGTVFRATPMIQLWLDQARDRAAKARDAEEEFMSRRKNENALNRLLGASEQDRREAVSVLAASYASANSEPVIVSIGNTDLSADVLGLQVSYVRYTPPTEVRLAPDMIVEFDQTPQANSAGPFSFTAVFKVFPGQ